MGRLRADLGRHNHLHGRVFSVRKKKRYPFKVMVADYTPHQKRYFAEQLTLSRPARELEALASSMSGVKIELKSKDAKERL
jgi:succinyl-CoA synthetase beta subunit